MVVWVEPPEDVFALRDGEHRGHSIRIQPDGVPSGPGDTDWMVYSLRRFLSLATAGNPSILLVLWAPVIHGTPAGVQVRALAPAFVGRHLVARYRGYMSAQVERLKGVGGGRHGRLRADETGAGFDTKLAMHAARLGYQGIELLTQRGLTLPIAGAAGEWLRDVRRGEVPLDARERRIAELDEALVELTNDASIQAGPDRDAIVEWSIAAHHHAWDEA